MDSSNTASGFQALLLNTTGANNTAVGIAALISNTGSDNIALGSGAGAFITTGSNNIDIGNGGVAGDANTMRIGSGSQFKTFISGISGVNEGSPTAVFINTTTGQLGTTPPASSRRYKKEIKPMDQTSEAVLGLKPVTFQFQYKSDTKGTAQFGLIAEEVAEINPDLVVRDDKGEICTVRYEAVNAMLLNEFLKEHRAFVKEQCKVEAQEATITQLKQDFRATVADLNARLKEQDSKIQKVSDQLEVNKPAPQMVLNNH
jgi:hypothetical protein